MLFVPLGAGPECLGFLVLTRVSDTPEWTTVERDAALDIGRDLGRAVANARQLARSGPSPTTCARSTAIAWRWSTPSATSCAPRSSR